MIFTTKYDLDQELFYIRENEVRSGCVRRIDINQTKWNDQHPSNEAVIIYTINDIRWREEDVAPSKAELISRL